MSRIVKPSMPLSKRPRALRISSLVMSKPSKKLTFRSSDRTTPRKDGARTLAIGGQRVAAITNADSTEFLVLPWAVRFIAVEKASAPRNMKL